MSGFPGISSSVVTQPGWTVNVSSTLQDEQLHVQVLGDYEEWEGLVDDRTELDLLPLHGLPRLHRHQPPAEPRVHLCLLHSKGE